MALSVCQNTDQFADVINTLIEAVDRHVNEIRTQLVLAVLLSEGKSFFVVFFFIYFMLYSQLRLILVDCYCYC